jgi:hypothetical protein
MGIIKRNILTITIVFLIAVSAYQSYTIYNLNRDYNEAHKQILIAQNKINCSVKVLSIIGKIRRQDFNVTEEDRRALDELDCIGRKI